MRFTTRNWRILCSLPILCGMVVMAGLLLGTGTATARDKPIKGPPDTGFIYYITLDGDCKMMLADGSQQTPLIPGEWPGVTEPSRTLHGSPPSRWFLAFKPRPEGGTYPDGSECVELFAIRNAEDERQLTDCGEYLQPIVDDPSLIIDPIVRWGVSPAYYPEEDTMVTMLARHWHATGVPQDPWDFDFGIYAVEFPDISTVQDKQVPVLKISCAGSDVGNYGELPDIASYDWNPDGTRMAYELRSAGIWVADVPQQPGTLPFNPYCVTSEGFDPRWSPIGDLIMFQWQYGVLWSIETIELDGSNRTLVTDGQYYKKPGKPWRYHWSPHATHVVYYRKGNWGTWYRPKGGMDIWLVGVDGSQDAILLKDASPIGWRDG